MRNIEDYTNQYLKGGFEDILVEYRRRKVLETVNNNVHNKICEIGCGMEPLFKYIEEFDEYVLFEPSKQFYDNAVNEAGKLECKDTICIKNEGFYEQPTKDFDLIICSGLLHELENPTEMVNQIRKSCGENTIVHINVPNAKSLHRLCALYAGMISGLEEKSERNITFQQHSVFSMETLIQFVENSGFYVVEKGSYFIKPFTHAQMEQMLEYKIVSKDVLEGLYRMSDELPGFGAEIYVNCKLLE